MSVIQSNSRHRNVPDPTAPGTGHTSLTAGGRWLRRAGQLSVLLVLGVTSACASWGQRETGAAVGGAAGGAVGAVIGSQSGSTARGAIIGAVVGGAAGAIIGYQMDQQARELESAVPNAVVERVGEGIHVTFPSGLLYDFDSSAIRGDAAVHLRTLAASLQEYPDTQLLIVGHTDATGNENYNQDLSVRRADAAKRFLAGQGVAERRVQVSGRGEWEPIATNETEAGRQANRRVEVAIYSAQGAGPQR
jgi:outer membrane protein OmpA-like peptidoglycan-associated protein